MAYSSTSAGPSTAATHEGDELGSTGSTPGGAEDMPTSKPIPKRRKGNRKWSAKRKEAAQLARQTKLAFLHGFVQLPLDIILEMFGHLHPKTLLAIARTSKRLRAMVFSQRHTGVWTNAREEAAIPRPPEGFSEPRWASLLFDTSCCQVCWNAQDSRVNWYFLRRICDMCFREHTIQLPARSYLPGIPIPKARMLQLVDIEIAEYIPWGRRPYSTALDVIYWQDDAVDVVKAWQELSKCTEQPGREAFQKWKMQRREIMRKNLSMIPVYELWKTKTSYPSKRLKSHREMRLVEENRGVTSEEIKARLREAGHKTEDIEMLKPLYPTPYILGRGTVSDAEWGRIRPLFEDNARSLKDFRAALEMELVTHERLLVLKDVYEGFLNTLPPSKRYYCPSASFLRTDSDTGAILGSERSIKITRAHFQPIVDKMPALIDQAHKKLKQSLIIPSHRSIQAGYVQGPGPLEPWSLAGNVFERQWLPVDDLPKSPANCILVGWDMIATHTCKVDSKVWLRPGVVAQVPRAFNINRPLSDISRKLIQMAGLPDIATVEEMDITDPRFVCERMECMGDTEKAKVFTWRSALTHLSHAGHATPVRMATSTRKPTPTTRMATAEEARVARDYEGPAREQTRAWSCNHCPEYLEVDAASTKIVVLTHLAQKHGVSDPIMPRDYFVNEGCRHAYEIPYTIQKGGRTTIRRRR